jgi:hypothetical protein
MAVCEWNVFGTPPHAPCVDDQHGRLALPQQVGREGRRARLRGGRVKALGSTRRLPRLSHAHRTRSLPARTCTQAHVFPARPMTDIGTESAKGRSALAPRCRPVRPPAAPGPTCRRPERSGLRAGPAPPARTGQAPACTSGAGYVAAGRRAALRAARLGGRATGVTRCCGGGQARAQPTDLVVTRYVAARCVVHLQGPDAHAACLRDKECSCAAGERVGKAGRLHAHSHCTPQV